MTRFQLVSELQTDKNSHSILKVLFSPTQISNLLIYDSSESKEKARAEVISTTNDFALFFAFVYFLLSQLFAIIIQLIDETGELWSK